MKYKYYQVYEYFHVNEREEKRLIYGFDDRKSAHDLIEFIFKHDLNPKALGVEEREATT